MVESKSEQNNQGYTVTLVDVTKVNGQNKKKHTVYSFKVVSPTGSAWQIRDRYSKLRSFAELVT